MQRLLTIFLAVFVLVLFPEIIFAEGKSRAVPPTLEIVVIDPNSDPVGNPAIELRPGYGNEMLVDVPPTILVHRFFYTGDRTFQAQFIKGGPSVVVVNHPRSGERVYVPVQMPPGAPRVTYRSSSIEYDFGRQGVKICFPLILHKPTVSYRNHRLVTRVIGNTFEKVAEKSKVVLDRSGITEAALLVHKTSKNVATTALDNTRNFTSFALRPIVQIGQFIPGVNALTSTPEDQAIQLRDAQQRQFEIQNSGTNVFIPRLP